MRTEQEREQGIDSDRKKESRKKTACGKPGFQQALVDKFVENAAARRTKEGEAMSNNRLLWTCPYYAKGDKYGVRCEGGRVKMPSTEAQKDYIRSYCTDIVGWRRCTVARVISRSYEKEEEA